MVGERMRSARARLVDECVVDWVLAGLLTLAALLEVSSQRDRGLPALVAVLVTATVAWRHRDPVLATLVVVAATLLYQLATGTSALMIEFVAVALCFYALGRVSSRSWRVLASVALLAWWFLAAAVIVYRTHELSVVQLATVWASVGGIPFAVGRALATRAALMLALAASASQLEDAQQLRAERAASEERTRMARELHDVIAHDVSVMVIQASAARRVVRGDRAAACAALQVVEDAGRDALVELRRTVGVLRRENNDLVGAGSTAPGISQLEALADRARAAGLMVDLHVEGPAVGLSPGVDLVAYRVVQEALTNVIKHAGAATVRVRVRVDERARVLELEVLDSGSGLEGGAPNCHGSGHGLVGMRERVSLYGGELRTGRGADGGFEVRAWLPLDGPPSPARIASLPDGEGGSATRGYIERLESRRQDLAFASAVFLALGAEVLTSAQRSGSLGLNLFVATAIAVATIWRRRAPFAFLIVVGVLAQALAGGLTSLDQSTLLGMYVALVPSYTIAAWSDRGKAVLGLALLVGGFALVRIAHPGPVGNLLGALTFMIAAWGVGRAMHARCGLIAELERRTARLKGESVDRARLAVAGERTRIARELHAVVARCVAAIVVQAEGAQRLLDDDLARAETAMRAIEDTGRQALTEMRRVLGVLRHGEEGRRLAPQPGVAQIHSLIQRARDEGRPVEMAVEGEPGTIPAGVDLGIYRILEDALASAGKHPRGGVGVVLRYGEDHLELRIRAACPTPNAWPTLAMRERVSLCGGDLSTEPDDDQDWRLLARLPRALRGVLV